MTACEINKLQIGFDGLNEDRRIINEGWLFLDEDLLEEYIASVKKRKKAIFGQQADEQILQLERIDVDGKPTMAGLLAFSQYPQSVFPGLGIVAAVVPGTEDGIVMEDGTHFLDKSVIEGSLGEMLEEAVHFVMWNTAKRTVVNEMGVRNDRWEYPLPVVREALLNALLHRDYSPHACGTPVRLTIYKDRIEIISCGGLYGGFPVNRLGSENAESRNCTLNKIMEFPHISENRSSGISMMKS